MARLIFILVLLIGLVLAIGMVLRAVSSMMHTPAPEQPEGNAMPPMVPKMAYTALLVIMFVSATGGLGGL